MKKLIILVLFLFCEQLIAQDIRGIPGPGPHFTVSVPPASTTLKITTTTPHWTYPTAGIKIVTQGYSIVGKTPNRNGFVLFSVSNTAPVNLTLSGPIGPVSIRLCLNGIGKTYTCEDYIVSVFSTHVIFVTSAQFEGNLKGTADNGAHGADAICQSVATSSGNSALNGLTFKALLVTSSRYPCSIVSAQTGCTGSFASDWPLIPGAQYVYANGESFFNTVNQNGVFEGTNPIINNETNSSSFSNFWSGTQSILSNGSGTDISGWAFVDMNSAQDGTQYINNLATCNSFTSNLNTLKGAVGVVGQGPLFFGSISPLTWGNYSATGFDDTLTSFLSNVFSSGTAEACNLPQSIVCVS